MNLQSVAFAALGFSALVPALLLHEVAHGWAALACGDPTAKEEGRLSLNPLRHVDPFMSVVLPAMLALSGSHILFGGAKPVPISLWRCRNPRRAYWMIAAAGPLANLLQALTGAAMIWLLEFAIEAAANGAGGVFRLLGTATSVPLDPWGLETETRFTVASWAALLSLWLYYFVSTNVALMVFNLIPIPPLDGSRIVTVLLPRRLAAPYARLERAGLLLVFALLWIPQTGMALSAAIEWILGLLGMP